MLDECKNDIKFIDTMITKYSSDPTDYGKKQLEKWEDLKDAVARKINFIMSLL